MFGVCALRLSWEQSLLAGSGEVLPTLFSLSARVLQTDTSPPHLSRHLSDLRSELALRLLHTPAPSPSRP